MRRPPCPPASAGRARWRWLPAADIPCPHSRSQLITSERGGGGSFVRSTVHAGVVRALGSASMIEDEAPADPVASRRPAYLADLAGGVDRFFEPRRTRCPWCDSAAVRGRVRTTDLLQHKPGRFALDE